MRRALLAMLIALAAPAVASAATPWVGFQPISGTNPVAPVGLGVSGADDFAVNGAGAAVAAWVDGDAHVRASRRSPAGTWSAPQVVSTAGVNAAGSVAVAIDAAGDATVLWAANTGTAFTTTALAGADFTGAQQTVASGLGGLITPGLRIAMNATGGAVAEIQPANSLSGLMASSSDTPGGAWAAAVQLSAQGAQGAVAINAAGDAVATYVEPVGGGVFSAYGALKPAGGTFPAGSGAFVLRGVDANTPPQPVIDSAGRVSVLVRTDQTPTDVNLRDSLFVVQRTAPSPTFTVLTNDNGDRVDTNCAKPMMPTSETNFGGRLIIDSSGAVTALYLCQDVLLVRSRPAGGTFTTASQIVTSTSTGQVPYRIAGTPDGHQIAVVSDGGIVRAYRRASSTANFGTGEALVDPDTTFNLDGIRLDDHADAVALVSKARSGGGFDLSSSLLDVTPGTGAITGPATATTGDLVTYTFTGSDPFGGFTGLPTWSSSDSVSKTAATYDRTFTAPGTYKIDVATTDVGGFPATASTTVKVGTPTPVATPTATAVPTTTATATPTASPTASPTPTPTTAPTVVCTVPKLKGKSVAQARKALKKAHCRLGKVGKPKRHGKKIARQTIAKGTQLPAGGKVKVTLKTKAR